MWGLVGNPDDRYSHNEAHFKPQMKKGTYQLGYLQASKLYLCLVSVVGQVGLCLPGRGKQRRHLCSCTVEFIKRAEEATVELLLKHVDAPSNRPYLESAIFEMCMISTFILASFERE